MSSITAKYQIKRKQQSPSKLASRLSSQSNKENVIPAQPLRQIVLQKNFQKKKQKLNNQLENGESKPGENRVVVPILSLNLIGMAKEEFTFRSSKESTPTFRTAPEPPSPCPSTPPPLIHRRSVMPVFDLRENENQLDTIKNKVSLGLQYAYIVIGIFLTIFLMFPAKKI